MKLNRVAVGLLNHPAQSQADALREKLRDLTICWSRYDYRGEITEAETVNEILDRAAELGYDWCLVLPCGSIITERWTPDDRLPGRHWLPGADALPVADSRLCDQQQGLSFDRQPLLVNLERYRRLGAPPLDTDPANFDLPRLSPGKILDLFSPTSSAFGEYLGEGIAKFDPQNPDHRLTADQATFLSLIRPQTISAREGVFLWNIESYADIETKAPSFRSPVRSLYSVAAGFKPNRILQTHGWDHSTRVVLCDYSRQALEIRKYLISHWDGEHFPDFVNQLFQVFPHPETFYQLWDGRTPENVDRAEIEQIWQRELDRWGGSRAFRDHWQSYVNLPHEFIHCNIMTDPAPLLDQMVSEPGAIIWWSNAFFTVYGNWFFTLPQRKLMYERWITAITDRNPDLFLFGSDYNNVNVNAIGASEYWNAYQGALSSDLVPCPATGIEIRM